jgi:hypothetical protein
METQCVNQRDLLTLPYTCTRYGRYFLVHSMILDLT